MDSICTRLVDADPASGGASPVSIVSLWTNRMTRVGRTADVNTNVGGTASAAGVHQSMRFERSDKSIARPAIHCSASILRDSHAAERRIDNFMVVELIIFNAFHGARRPLSVADRAALRGGATGIRDCVLWSMIANPGQASLMD